MILHNRQLALVPFAHPESQAALLCALSSIGYSTLKISPQQLCNGLADNRSEAIVFLLGTAASRDLVISAIDHSRVLPSFVIFAKSECEWDPTILERCCDFSTWPCGTGELAFRLSRVCGAGCEVENSALDPTLSNTLMGLNLIGHSPPFVNAMRRLRQAAQCDASVVISGETGTGKELVARAIHYLGPRAGGPFVPINCGALPDHLVENELFGHERGAYTDARGFSAGAIGEAAGGTLFLDEVEALSPKAQVALLRFLQDSEYRPLGGRRAHHADVRIVAAGNADLHALSKRREFRIDLYFRLNVLSLELPPLRQRAEDIELLAKHFIALYCRKYNTPRKTLDGQSLCRLRNHRWPGNVRELENLIHREVLRSTGLVLHLHPETDSPSIASEHLGDQGLSLRESFAVAKANAIAEFEKDYLIQLISQTKGNVTRAARIAGKERRALGKLLKKHEINPRYAS